MDVDVGVVPPPPLIIRFLHPENIRSLLLAYPEYRSACRWGMFLNTLFVFAVASRDQEEIIQLLPEAHAVAEGSIWGLDNLRHRVVRTRNNLITT